MTPTGTGALKYPLTLDENQVDYLVFTAHEYRTNRAVSGQAEGFAGGTLPGADATIVLYMPTTTPAVANANGWNSKSFQGDLGVLFSNLASNVAGQVDGFDLSNYSAGQTTGQNVVDGAKTAITDALNQGGGAIKQGVTRAVAGMAGMNANQLVALQRGQIYNPNVELLYEGPKVRGFNFSFPMVPKSEEEAAAINRIILEFKKWSSPELQEGNGMYKVPHIWQVRYMKGSSQNKNMNAFKRAALTDIAVQNNQGLNMHMSYEDGMPIITTISLNFTEVDVITRADHLDGTSSVGY
jgi:hypothetical protein